ncbi:MAG TPA: molybdopterin molybdotransferase MoeA [Dongiaceae bacterium]|nr:molybdopterin molybdotransferase MoeA [Dongiaceae bacterium]
MAQLSDDCFAGAARLMPLAEALRSLEKLPLLAASEDVPLEQAAFRFAAADISTSIDVPGHTNAAVDGYAVAHAALDPTGETRLKVMGRASAGHPYEGAEGVVRIFTGAVLPDRCDTIVMQEDCREENGAVIVPPGITRGANVRQRGEDVRAGRRIIAAGQRLLPQHLALAAACGMTRLAVRVPLRVGLFSTGDEVRETERNPGQVFDSNRILLRALLERWGMRPVDLGLLTDTRGTIAAALQEAALGVDLLITSGGVSTGEEDHVRAAIEEIGTLHFWRLAIKPGRPVALGQIATPRLGVPIVGLPGNPVAVFINMVQLVRPILMRLSGATLAPPTLFPAKAGFSWRKKPGRREWLRVSVTGRTADGLPLLGLFPRDGAGIISSLTESDGLVELAEDCRGVSEGARVDFLPYAECW